MGSQTRNRGLEYTLFDRLSESGISIVSLNTQYRMHPRISELSNTLFYNRALRNGKKEADFPPMVQGLFPVVFFNHDGCEKKVGAGHVNIKEAGIVKAFVDSIISYSNEIGAKKIERNDIGVISFYKSQAALISTLVPGISVN